jgi:bla regulator protein blaR1
MIGAFTDHLWQSTLFVLAAALLAAALRQNGAHVRHRIWLIASVKFLVPLSLLIGLGGALPQINTPAALDIPVDVPDFSLAVEQMTQPFTSGAFVSSATVSEAGANWIPWLIAGLWAGGFATVVGMRVRGWQRVRAALRTSTAVPVTAPVPVRSSPGLLEPGVVGLWQPVLLVPEGIEHQLPPRQFEAVLLHEWCHVQRRDNLTSAIHMVVEAIFWFHPLVWFVGARLVDERERACDEFVLRTSDDPAAYAESILNVCKLYVESPVACISGVTGSDIKRRIAAILTNRIGLQLSAARRSALIVAALLAVVLPIAAGMLMAPLRASSFAALQNSPARATYPKFDVVSVKPCEPNAPGQTRGGGGTPITSPGRLYLQCYPLSSLIREAYLFFADGRAHGLSSVINVPVEGGPGWMTSERFLIEAKSDQMVPAAVMRGPMLQAVLEDRFKLKIRRVTRDMPVYELVIAKSGAKVSPYTGTDCVIKDEAAWPPPPLAEGQRYCGDRSKHTSDLFIREGVMTLDELVSLFNFDRPVVNRTGITAPVSYRVEFAREDAAGGEAPRASWISALRNQLGLDLREGKGPREFLVIDHAERPTPDPPSPNAPFTRGFGEASSAPARGPGAQ